MKFRPEGLNIDSFFCEHLNDYTSDAFNASPLLKEPKYMSTLSNYFGTQCMQIPLRDLINISRIK